MTDDQMPTISAHRGVAIYDFRSSERIETVVKPAIDRVLAMSDVLELFAFAADIHRPPELRLFAAAKIRAAHEIASNSRTQRPLVDLEQLDAFTVALDTLDWASPTHYGRDVDHIGEPRPAEFRAALERAQRLARTGAPHDSARVPLRNSRRAPGRGALDHPRRDRRSLSARP